MHMHITEKEKKQANIFIDLLTILAGTALSAVALNMLTIPSGLLAGGTTGIAQFINHFFPISVGVFFFILNIPLMIAAYIFLGKKFSIYTIISITLVSSFLYFFPVQLMWTDNILLAAIFGGVLNGIGCGIILRRGGSQGGIDILSRIIAKYSNVSVGKANLTVNVMIVIASGFLFGSEIALYTIISMFASMKTYEVVLDHVNRVTILIVTEIGEDVNTAINSELHRGTTMWEATGGYTHHEKTVLLCVAVKGQVTQLKKLIKSVDEHAFISVISTQNVIGRFKQIW
ncbi:YitT family protein [Ureibacillus manganicus]|uniref:YitT family protein n=1 Tax=Ureibacillus manganicus TaxID=1266064 RepID=UPI00068FC100|nr:YitT family protein [Ureibacillus manganicus]